MSTEFILKPNLNSPWSMTGQYFLWHLWSQVTWPPWTCTSGSSRTRSGPEPGWSHRTRSHPSSLGWGSTWECRSYSGTRSRSRTPWSRRERRSKSASCSWWRSCRDRRSRSVHPIPSSWSANVRGFEPRWRIVELRVVRDFWLQSIVCPSLWAIVHGN